MHRLTNVPTKDQDREIEIRVVVDGSNIKIVRAKRDAAKDDWAGMTEVYVGDHMLSRPDDLRRMIGDAVASAIRLGRDAGYNQAKREIRNALGIER